ncbi:MAG: hypothetical protein K6G76_12465 [Lachnospiraceae bacterium]|nr:hypothetical protein [Lachnospiraceae bacterium]
MVCKKCKHEIGPTELKCPHCGADNEFAQKHLQNMNKFEGGFEKTEKEVIKSAKKTEGLAKRAIILVSIIAACIVLVIIDSLCYKDFDDDKRKNEMSDEEYVADAKDLLKQGEYMDFAIKYSTASLDLSSDEWNDLKHVRYVANDYGSCIRYMERMILRSTDPDYFDALDYDIESFCRNLDGFYEVLNVQKEAEKNEEYLTYIEDMDSEIRAAMKTYFSMDDAALEDFLSLSEAQKGVKVEEVLRHE